MSEVTSTRGRPALMDAVIANSVASSWGEARREWEPAGGDLVQEANAQCICGQQGLVYLFRILNPLTGVLLEPIGSDCIRYFEDEALDDEVLTLTALWEMEALVAAHVPLDLKHLSRAKIALLYECGAITFREYEFLLDMFNRRRELTGRQSAWAVAILRSGSDSVRAFLTNTAAGNRPRARVRTLPEEY